MSEMNHDAHPPAHETDGAGHGEGHGDEHEGRGAALGPIDWLAWGAGLLGVGAGLAVAVCLYVSTTL